MADKTISSQPLAGALGGTEAFQIIQGGNSRRVLLSTVSSFAIAQLDGNRGDITVSASGLTWTINNSAVTFAKFQNINTAVILGRNTASTGNVEEIARVSAGEKTAGTETALRAFAPVDIADMAGTHGGGGGGGAATFAFQGFRAEASVVQAITASTATTVDFGTEIFDTEAAFASNVFTVPAGLDGTYMVFTAGVRFDATENGTIYLQQDNAGGGTFANIATDAINGSEANVASGPVLVNTGDVIRVQLFMTTAANVQNDPRSFFSGAVLAASFVQNAQVQPAALTANHIVTNDDLAGNVFRRIGNTTDLTITVNTGLTGTEPCTFVRTNTGNVTFVAGGGVTIKAADNDLSLRVDGSQATLTPDLDTSNLYYLAGDLTT